MSTSDNSSPSSSLSPSSPHVPPTRPIRPEPPLRSGIPAAVLILFYLTAGSVPLFVSWRNGDAAGNFWRDLSDGAALVAFCLLTIQFVISGRIRWVSGRIGIDRLMHFHQMAAKAITVTLLIHPFIYALPHLAEDGFAAAVTSMIDMWTNPAFGSGVTAWILLVVVMAMAMLREWLPIRYEAWRISHGLGAAAVAAAGLHHALSTGGAHDDVNLAQIWIMFVAVAFGTLGYLYLVKPWKLAQEPFYVSRITPLGNKLWGVTIWPAKTQPVGMLASVAKARVTKPIAYEAGQFAWVTIGASPYVFADHPLSFASAPSEGSRLRFVVKEAGDFTSVIGRIPKGTRAYVDGPYGSFTLSAAPEPDKAAGIAFIAGGVGIAPILSLLRDRRAADDRRPLRLLTGNRSASQIVYRDELADMAGERDFRVRHVVSEPPREWPPHDWPTGVEAGTGVLDEANVTAWIDWPDPERWLYFVCGPAAMMDAVERTLRARGVPSSRIISERFRYD